MKTSKDKEERTILYAAETARRADGVDIYLSFNTAKAQNIFDEYPEQEDDILDELPEEDIFGIYSEKANDIFDEYRKKPIITEANKEAIEGSTDFNILSELHELVEYLPVLKQAILDKKININEKIQQRGAASFTSVVVHLFKSTGDKNLLDLFNFLLDNNADLENAFSIETYKEQRKPLIKYIYQESFSGKSKDTMQKLLLKIIKHDNYQDILLKKFDAKKQKEILIWLCRKSFLFEQKFFTKTALLKDLDRYAEERADCMNGLSAFINMVGDTIIYRAMRIMSDNQNLGEIDIILTERPNLYKRLVNYSFQKQHNEVITHLIDNCKKFDDEDFTTIIAAASQYKNALSAQLITYLMENHSDVIKKKLGSCVSYWSSA